MKRGDFLRITLGTGIGLSVGPMSTSANAADVAQRSADLESALLDHLCTTTERVVLETRARQSLLALSAEAIPAEKYGALRAIAIGSPATLHKDALESALSLRKIQPSRREIADTVHRVSQRDKWNSAGNYREQVTNIAAKHSRSAPEQLAREMDTHLHTDKALTERARALCDRIGIDYKSDKPAQNDEKLRQDFINKEMEREKLLRESGNSKFGDVPCGSWTHKVIASQQNILEITTF